MPGELDGKVAFVTGAARGQGRAHSLRLAQAGCDIVAVDICAQIDGVEYPMSVPADLAETAKLVEDLGGRIVTGFADVRDPSALRTVHEDGLAEFGRLDFVIANAGVMPIFGDASNTVAIWQLCLDVLLTGVLHTVETTYPQLVDQGDGGSIVITGSMAALQPMMRTEGRHTYGMLGYAAAKAALCNLCRNYASFLAVHRIRVNTVHPTGVNTPMVANDMVSNYFARAQPEEVNMSAHAIPVQLLEPEDVANAVLWLCSDESSYYTGNDLRVDAGASLR
jgi:SDR family mycofactocin-dependent oxidoreductase